MLRRASLIHILKKMLTAKAAGQTLAEVERVLSGLRVREKEILQLYIDTKNKAHMDEFRSTPFFKRILLLPQYLRSQDCPAGLDQRGYQCKGCGKCCISSLIIEAIGLGYRVFILPGGTILERILHEFKPKACLGVACLKEIILGSFISERNGVATIGVPLLRDGCFRTDANWNDVRTIMNLSAV
jgi:hypothetical protein